MSVEGFLDETARVAEAIDRSHVELMCSRLKLLRELRGRLFLAGLGGSAANASHAANDFRKLAEIPAICLSDNIAELTARANDEGWDVIYSDALEAHGSRYPDALMILSVGGGTSEVSRPLVRAVDHAVAKGVEVLAIVGRDGGHAARHARSCVLIPEVSNERVTAHTEAFQAVILHCIVSELQRRPTKW